MYIATLLCTMYISDKYGKYNNNNTEFYFPVLVWYFY